MATKIIGLDAGHGLKTPGKQTPDGIKEWTLNDKVRDKVVAYLSDYDCKIIHCDNNEGNTDESISARVAKYLNAGVDALVSLHHNAYTGNWNGATGVETYTDRAYTKADDELAKAIQTRLVKYTGLTDRGVKRTNFDVINTNKVPAVLVEGGFMDGTKDYKVITSDAGQTAYAKAVAEALIEFLKLEKKEIEPVKDYQGHWAEKVLDYVVEKKYMVGDGKGTLRPNDTLTRAEIAQILYNYDQINKK